MKKHNANHKAEHEYQEKVCKHKSIKCPINMKNMKNNLTIVSSSPHHYQNGKFLLFLFFCLGKCCVYIFLNFYVLSIICQSKINKDFKIDNYVSNPMIRILFPLWAVFSCLGWKKRHCNFPNTDC